MPGARMPLLDSLTPCPESTTVRSGVDASPRKVPHCDLLASLVDYNTHAVVDQMANQFVLHIHVT